MRFAVIGVDGELTHHVGELDWDAVVGPEGCARVRLGDLAVSAFVNDVGHRFPERYPRNVVGSCVLAALGAYQLPYAGPVVLTGWDPGNTLLDLSEIVPLPQPGWLTNFHRHVRAALDGRPTPHPERWAAAIREFADTARTAPTPTLTIRPVRSS